MTKQRETCTNLRLILKIDNAKDLRIKLGNLIHSVGGPASANAGFPNFL